MKLRETEFYGLLLVVSAGLAWWAYQIPVAPQKSEASETIDLWSGAGELNGIRFERQRLTVDIMANGRNQTPTLTIKPNKSSMGDRPLKPRHQSPKCVAFASMRRQETYWKVCRLCRRSEI